MASPHPYFTDDPQGLRYEEGRDFSAMAVVLPFCLFFLGFGVMLIFEVATWQWHMGTAMAILTAIAFLAFSLMTGLLSLVAVQPQRLVFDAIGRRLTGRARGRLWLLFSVDIRFDELQSPEIRSFEQESNGYVFDIHIPRDGAFSLKLGSYGDRAEAEHWQARIAAMIARPG